MRPLPHGRNQKSSKQHPDPYRLKHKQHGGTPPDSLLVRTARRLYTSRFPTTDTFFNQHNFLNLT